MTTRGDRTRELIISAAELLFAERGLNAVSLREINVAAGQRNTAALHYHFNGRSGVIAAIAARHMPRVEARQRELLVKADADGNGDDLRTLVDAVFRPAAEYIEMGASERAWMKIGAAYVAQPAVTAGHLHNAGTSTGREVRRRWARILREQMPREIARERVLMIYTAAFSILAGRARLLDDAEPGRPILPADVFALNLCDMCCGALTAPVSRAIAEALVDG